MSEDRSLRQAFGRFCVLLLASQLVRAAFAWFFTFSLKMAWQYANPLTILVMGIFALAVARPTMAQLGLDLTDLSKTSRWIHLAVGLFVLVLLAIPTLMDPSQWMVNLNSVVITPIVEELLFRGLGWSRISGGLQQKNNSLWTWIIVSVLFGLWHLLYVDVLLWFAPIRPSPSGLPMALIGKALVGGFIGGAAGLLRWKTKHLPAAIYVHAIFNLFGR